jgi:hypothetical protein
LQARCKTASAKNQGWQPGGNKPYAYAQLDAGRLKSLQLYDRSISSIAEVVHRFMPPTGK